MADIIVFPSRVFDSHAEAALDAWADRVGDGWAAIEETDDGQPYACLGRRMPGDDVMAFTVAPEGVRQWRLEDHRGDHVGTFESLTQGLDCAARLLGAPE